MSFDSDQQPQYLFVLGFFLIGFIVRVVFSLRLRLRLRFLLLFFFLAAVLSAFAVPFFVCLWRNHFNLLVSLLLHPLPELSRIDLPDDGDLSVADVSCIHTYSRNKYISVV